MHQGTMGQLSPALPHRRNGCLAGMSGIGIIQNQQATAISGAM
jgi:hypothetical protein